MANVFRGIGQRKKQIKPKDKWNTGCAQHSRSAAICRLLCNFHANYFLSRAILPVMQDGSHWSRNPSHAHISLVCLLLLNSLFLDVAKANSNNAGRQGRKGKLFPGDRGEWESCCFLNHEWRTSQVYSAGTALLKTPWKNEKQVRKKRNLLTSVQQKLEGGHAESICPYSKTAHSSSNRQCNIVSLIAINVSVVSLFNTQSVFKSLK